LLEEGVIQLFKTVLDNQLILGAVGVLQFDVVQFRLENEYSAKCEYQPFDLAFAYWIGSEDRNALIAFQAENKSKLAKDAEDKTVCFFKGQWELHHIQKNHPHIHFYKTSECKPQDLVG